MLREAALSGDEPHTRVTDLRASPNEVPTLAPALMGQRVELRPVVPEDYPYLFSLSLDPRICFRWRLRNTTPSFEGFVAGLFQGILAQFLVVERSTGERSGLISVYNVDFKNDIGYLAMVLDPRIHGTPMTVEALSLFMNYVFTSWPLRKVYAETTELSYPQFEGGKGRLFELEGVYPEHEYYDGRYWCMYMLAFYRTRWEV